MKLENVGRAVELAQQRDHVTAVIRKLESETITLNGDDGLPFETPDDFILDKIIIVYTSSLMLIAQELKEL